MKDAATPSQNDASCSFGLASPVSGAPAEPTNKKEILLASWNVRTLGDERAQTIAKLAFLQCEVGIACLSEVRLPDSELWLIRVPETTAV